MKRFTLSLACAVLIGSYATADPIEFEGLNYELDETRGTASVVAGEYAQSDVVIPESITADGKNYAVTAVGASAFQGNTAIISLTLPNSIQTIGNSAFMSCRGLTTVNWGSGIRTVDTNAFGADTKISAVNITDLKAWAETEFANGNASPAGYAKKISLNDEVITELVIPDDVTKIGNYTFYNVNNLQSITIGSGVQSIGENAFYYCYNVKSLVIPDNVKEIKKAAFSSMRSVTELTIGTGVETIPEEAFISCQALKILNIPDNVKTIGANAFKSCNALSEINFGTGQTSIAKDAFILNRAIKTVNAPSIDMWCNIDFETMNSNPVSISKSLTIGGEPVTDVVFPTGLGKVKPFTFHSVGSLETISLPDDVTEIGASAFYLCSSLTGIEMPDCISTIGTYAFQSCTSLAEITLPENLEAIPDNMFNNDTALNSVTLPVKVTSIGSFAFGGCTGLKGLEIPEGVTTVGSYAFQNCTSIERLVFPKVTTAIGSSALAGCSALKYIQFQAPQITFGYNAINNCSSLEEIWINNSTVTYKTFPATVTLYVPFGSVETWSEQYPKNSIKEAGVIELDADHGMATYYVFASYKMPEGMEGCAIAGVSGKKLVKGEVFGSGVAVPYDTPLLITGECGDFRMFEVTRDNTLRFEGDNVLRGSNKDDIVMKDPVKAYFKLGYNEYETEFGFMPVLDNGGFEVAAHTAFMELPADEANEDGYLIKFKGDEPAQLYLVGKINDWAAPVEENAEKFADYVLTPTQEGSEIYTGEFEFNAGTFNGFRFYSSLDGWNNSSIGAQENDEMMTFVFTDNQYTGSLVMGGKGSWQLPDDFEGKITMTVNLEEQTVNYVAEVYNGIENILIDAAAGVKVYTIDGRHVNADSINDLEPGLYIVNGRKVLVNK